MLIKQGYQLEELPLEDRELRRSIATYKWMMEEGPKMGYKFMITPTVELELISADQVSVLSGTSYYHILNFDL
jgi:hypothetical protein